MKIARKELVKIISESVMEVIGGERPDWYDENDMSYREVAEKCWAGEITQISSLHEPTENIRHIGNVYGETPMECYGRLLQGVDTGTVYFLEL